MKKLFISALSMLAVAMGFTACTSDDVTSTPDTPKQITLYATTEQPSATRTSLNVDEGSETDGYEVLWSAGDQIKLINEASNYAVFTLNNEYAEKSTGEFTGSSLDDDTYTAYYPADYDGTSWPTAQTYEENNIPDGVPMKAENVEVADGTVAPISFKNEGGILRLNLKGEAKVTSITISATNLTNPITLSCGTGVQLDADMTTPFYIAVPGADDPGTAYSGLKIVITDDAGKVCTKTLKSDKTITVQRSMITDITLTASGFKATTGTAKATIGGSEVDVNWVQLWADGPKFAEYNVGVTDGKAENYGGYYAWGGSQDKGDDHHTGSDFLTGDADTATKLWGSNWRMPTSAEFIALFNNCTWELTTVNDVPGCKYTGKNSYSSNSIFLPAGGSYYKDTLSGDKYCGQYWSSNQDPEDDMCGLSLYYNQTDAQYLSNGCLISGHKLFVRAVLAE